jgi:hypothetical protein
VKQKAGRVIAAGITKEATFERAVGLISDRIDEAYRAKWRGGSYLSPMVGAGARSATVKIVPRGAHGKRGRSSVVSHVERRGTC